MSERDLLRAAIVTELGNATMHVRALIDQACALSEQEVLAVGERIDDMHHEAQGNVASLTSLEEHFDSSSTAGRTSLDTVMQKNARVMEGYARRLAEGMEQQRASTIAVTEVARKIGAFVAGVERVSSELRMLTLNARLEAARWGNQGAAFATVASSMKDLTGQVCKANEQIGGLASELCVIAKSVAENEHALEEVSKGLATDVTTQMASLAGAYEATRVASAIAVKNGVERGQRLVQLSNAVLSNLQFQDRLAQVLREAEVVVVRAESVTSELLASVPEGASADEAAAAIDGVLARAAKPVVRMSGESELASSDLALDAGVVEMF